ncbi:COG3014 family protein [Paludibacterium paludis]|uniref:Uncharacterized protein n=1 Tax=Paludibacterium paludis TaxID=1225769 RepID=A0A918UBM2_9NEIS|nr:hypothetical protein [Paludibacterium paludis]GGY25346.1 hypothetical protein GCM10011289_31170 [Paludibacterium paludis]
MRSYHKEMEGTLAATREARLDDALQTIEKNNTGDDKDLLYFLEKGEVLRLKGDLSPSVESWMKADEKVRQWEEESRLTLNKTGEAIGSVLINDKVRRYDGQNYEKVMLSTFLTLNNIQLGNSAAARTEIKKTHEREALIAALNEKEYDKVEESAKKNKVTPTFKTLKGYPVETLDDPEVLNLKNGYQSAFSHYLAGYVYESLGEKSLAAPGYRKAIELRPNQPLLEQGLKELDSRMSGRGRKGAGADVLFVVESGFIPARTSMTIPLPVLSNGNAIITQIAFPVIRSSNSYLPANLSVSGKSVPLSVLANLDAMSRRALRDEMPGIIVRSTVRAIAKGVAQKELNDRMGAIGGLAGIAATVLTEQADERAWRTLPAYISVARTTLKKGDYTVTVPTPNGLVDVKVSVPDNAGHLIVPLRLVGQQVIKS